MICARNAIFATYRLACVAAVSMTLAACADKPPEPQIVTVFRDAPRFEAPQECDNTRDPKWANPPDADVRLKESARIMRENKQNSIDIAVKRNVCWSAIATYRQQPQSKGKSSNGK